MNQERINVMWLIKGLGSGGAENLLVSAAKHVDRDRFNYSAAYFLPWKDQLVEGIEAQGIPVTCFKQRVPYDLRALFALNRKLRKDKIDILHAHLPYSGLVGRLASKFSPVKKVVYSEHNVWERYNKVMRVANKFTYKMNDAVVAVSENVEESIRSGMNVGDSLRLNTIENGVDVEQLSTLSKASKWLKEELGIPAENRIVTCVANFTPKKRHTDLLAAAKRTLASTPDVSFVLVGIGPLLDDVKAEAKTLGIDKNVVFTGLREDAREIIAASDMFMLSSEFEGMPISVLEAMGTKTPVLSTRVGGLPEMLVEGTEGMMVDSLNPEKLSDAINDLLANETLRRSLAERAFVRVTNEFDIRHMVKRHEQLYLEIYGAVMSEVAA